MKRKQEHLAVAAASDSSAPAAVAATAATAGGESGAKRARAQTEDKASVAGSTSAPAKHVIELDESIDVETFFRQDCDRAAERLLEQTKARCADLRSEFERSKQAILSSIAAEKENLQSDPDATPRPNAFAVSIACVAGPYKGHMFALHLDTVTRRSGLIGRSTGRKFRAPNGLSLPKDAEVSTTHAQLRLEPDGRVVFVDLDSTNGSYINDESVEPHEPHELSTSAPTRVSIGATELLMTVARQS